MSDQLDHALQRRTPVLKSRSKAEVAAINMLQRVYDTLLMFNVDTADPCSSPMKMVRPSSAKRAPCTPSRSIKASVDVSDINTRGSTVSARIQPKHTDDASNLEQWAYLAESSTKLAATAKELGTEVAASERKCDELRDDPSSYLPPVDVSDLAPRMQALHSVLGASKYQQYHRDLYSEIAHLRRRTRLYSSNRSQFLQRVSTLKSSAVSVEALYAFLNRFISARSAESDSTDSLASSEAISTTEYPVLVQQCAHPSSPDHVSLHEFATMMKCVPEERERLLRHTFEQLSDGWRGEGYAPPPDRIRPHRLRSILKDSFAHQQCSASERDVVSKWIDGFELGGGSVHQISLQDFSDFHHEISDEFPIEDAEFVRFLVRIWCFSPTTWLSHVAIADRDIVARIIQNNDERSAHEQLLARKREILGKIDKAQNGISSRLQQLQNKVEQLSSLDIKDPKIGSWWNEPELSEHFGSALTNLRSLTGSSLSLAAFPSFLTSFVHLEVLNLRDNRISSIPGGLAMLTTLERLDLSANCLCDSSFSGSKCSWGQLTALRELVLRGNRLTSFPSAIMECTALTQVDLSGNSIRNIPNDFVGDHCKLRLLDLHHNALTSLPEEVGKLRHLRTLRLHENKLTTLPSSMHSLLLLEELTLWENKLGPEMAEISLTEHQTELDLNHNCFAAFPRVRMLTSSSSSQHNTSILRIAAAYNQLRVFALSPITYSRCQKLHLEHNGLKTLPDELLAVLPCLEELSLHHNRLRQLPSSITQCKTLRVIDVHANRLAEVPTDLVELTSLQVFDATANNLQTIPCEWHAFEQYTENGVRVMRKLALKKNSIANSVLKAVIDGTDREARAELLTVAAGSSGRICDGVVRKLISGLQDAAATAMLEVDSSSSSDSGSDDRDTSGIQRRNARRSANWRGITRNINRYLARRLQAVQQSESEAGQQLVAVKSFERMIKSLPFSCSKLELGVLVDRFTICDGAAKRWVDGGAFLHAIDQFGKRGTLSAAPKDATQRAEHGNQRDEAAAVLHYLSVVARGRKDSLERKYVQQAKAIANDGQQTASPKTKTVKSRRASHVEKAERPKSARTPAAIKASREREVAAASAFVKRIGDPERDKELARQRQRVQILKQQLMDQKLLAMGKTQHANASMIASARMDESESDSTDDDTDAAADSNSELNVWVAVTKISETAGASPSAKPQYVRLQPRQTVLELKQQLEVLTRVRVDDQILIAKNAGQSVGIRLRNESFIQEYASAQNPTVHQQKRDAMRVLLLPRYGI